MHLLRVLWGGQISFSGLETNTGCPNNIGATLKGSLQLAKEEGLILGNSWGSNFYSAGIFSLCLQWKDMLVHIPNSADRARA